MLSETYRKHEDTKHKIVHGVLVVRQLI